MSKHNRERKKFKALKKDKIPLTPYQQIRIKKHGKRLLNKIERGLA